MAHTVGGFRMRDGLRVDRNLDLDLNLVKSIVEYVETQTSTG